jgi:hypothetical protein
MNIGKRVNDLLSELSTIAEGPAQSLNGRVSSSSSSSSRPRGQGTPLQEEWEGRFERLLELAALDLAKYRRSEGYRVRIHDREDKNARIISVLYRGRPSSFVAHAEDCDESHVRKLRQKAGMEATTGRRR